MLSPILAASAAFAWGRCGFIAAIKPFHRPPNCKNGESTLQTAAGSMAKSAHCRLMTVGRAGDGTRSCLRHTASHWLA